MCNENTMVGATYAWYAISQDFCIIVTLECLNELCDSGVIVFGGTDGTPALILKWLEDKPNWKYLEISEDQWLSVKGREKLSHFSNIAIANLETDYVFYLQADEILHESCFESVRELINFGAESYMCKRINLWATPYHHLNVPQERKPVSTEIIRLAKREYRCVDDAESIGVPSCDIANVDAIRIYHMGFVRDKYKHLDKIIHMQKDVFLMDYDKRVHDCEDGFDPWKFGFTPKDIVPNFEPLPKFIQQWARDRAQDPFKHSDHGINMAKMYLDSIHYEDPLFKMMRYPDYGIVYSANAKILDEYI